MPHVRSEGHHVASAQVGPHQVGGAGLKQKEMSLLYKVSRPGSPQLKWNSFQSATKQQGISTQRKALMWKKYKEIAATTIASAA